MNMQAELIAGIQRQPQGPAFWAQSESDEWYTPGDCIAAVREVLGVIDIDPASNEAANRTVKARVFFDRQSNGLAQDWPGKVFLNPPYGGKEGPFINKLIQQYRRGITTEAIILVPANTDTDWFQPLWDYLICFVRQRIRFIPSDGRKISSPSARNVFVYFGKQPSQFKRAFSRWGAISRAEHCDPIQLELGQQAVTDNSTVPVIRNARLQLELGQRAVTDNPTTAPVIRNARQCPSCLTAFVPKRSDAEFCSTRCRMRNHRRSIKTRTAAGGE